MKNAKDAVPSHVAIIMDGNARWAKKNGLSIEKGHQAGSENIREICKSCIKLGIKYLTIYAFSTENWNRPKSEVNHLLLLLNSYLKNEIKELNEKGVKLIISGNLERLPKKTVKQLEEAVRQTELNQALTLNVAFSYSSRQELVDATKKIASAVKSGQISVEQISEDLIVENLYQPQIPDPDFLIRTAGDFRLSNFLLWQAAYTELYFTKTFWPDFGPADLVEAINDFNRRDRKFGER